MKLLIVGMLLLGSAFAGDVFTLKRGGLDCAPNRIALVEVHAARLKYYGTDNIDFEPPDTDTGYNAFTKVADLMIKVRSMVLGRTIVEVLTPQDRNGIMILRTSGKQICYVWAKDLTSLRYPSSPAR